MTDGADAIAEADPFVVRRSAAETDGEFVRLESTMYPADAASGTSLSHEPWGLDNDFEHVHPEQEERWEVLSGELRVALDGEEQTLTDGEEVTLPVDVPHRHWNPTDDPIRVVWERSPAFRTEEWAESVYALAQAGNTDEEGVPNLLQVAVWIDAYSRETAYPTALPVGLQKAVAAVVAPLGRRFGFEPSYSRSDVEGRE